jgi:hypothetical protein
VRRRSGAGGVQPVFSSAPQDVRVTIVDRADLCARFVDPVSPLLQQKDKPVWYLGCRVWQNAPNSMKSYQHQWEEDGICLVFEFTSFGSTTSDGEATAKIERVIDELDLNWLAKGADDWTIDTERMLDQFPELPRYQWLPKTVRSRPESDRWVEKRFGLSDEYFLRVKFYFTRREIVPAEIQESLELFRADYPDASKVGFLMMNFASTEAHQQIARGVREAFAETAIVVLTIDENQYHKDRYWNLLTYAHGVSFGVAVFERGEGDDFNPNVAFAVGYMQALGNDVCVLKDSLLDDLQTDLIVKTWYPFDPRDLENSVQTQVELWARDRGLIS